MCSTDPKDILKALSEVYISIFVFDLKENTLEAYKTNPFIEMWSEGFKTAQDKTSHVMRNITKDQYINEILEFVKVATIAERMGDKKVISKPFEGKVNGWCKARFIELDRDEEGNLWHVLYTVEPIDSVEAK